MAKTAIATIPNRPSSNAPLVPIVTDPRTELFFLIGKAGYDCNPRMAERMMELAVIITSPAAESTEGQQ